MIELYKEMDSDVHQTNVEPTVELQELIARNKLHRRKDNILLCCILLVGLVGFFYVSSLPGKWNSRDFTENDDLNTTSQSMAARSYAQYETTESLNTENYLSIDGVQEAGERLRFSLESFNEEFTYTLHLGRGISKVINEKTVYFSYPQQGVYEVKLEAAFKGQIKELSHKELVIHDAILVASGAMVER